MDFELFRKNLMKVRISKGISGKELSERANLRQKKRVNDIEEGRGKPSLEEVCSLCKELNVNIDSMLYKVAEVSIEFKSNVPF